MSESTVTETAYCPYCGRRLRQRKNAPPRCPPCGRTLYADPKFAAAAIIPLDGGIALVQRAIEPGLGKWSFPSGYVNRWERPERAVERETLEESGLEVTAKWVVGVYSTPHSPVVLCVYHAEVRGGTLIAGDETLAAKIFPVDDLPTMAFRYDHRIVEDWLYGRRLRGEAG